MSLAGKLNNRIRWFRRSSMLRLTALLCALFALGMAIAIVVALSLGRSAVEARVDATLATLAAEVAAGQSLEDTPSRLVRPVTALDDLPRAFSASVAAGGGAIELKDDFRDADVWRMLIASSAEGAPVLIAVPMEESEEALEVLGGILWATGGVVLAAALILGLGAGVLAQRRLTRITETLARLAAGDLQARTGIDRSADDLDALARRLDETADDLERLVTQTRNLSASIAHDLRTPLARLRAQLDRLPESDARSAALGEAARLSAIFDAIMRVAQIDAAQGSGGFEAIDLAELATEVAEIFGPVVEDSGKRLRTDMRAPGKVRADRQMLMQALANLIQNALVHGGPEVILFAHEQTIGVADNGDGVTPTLYGEILKPMVRLDKTRNSPGAGLGLALVRAVADRHKADLRLAENSPTGLRVSLQFTDA